MSQTKKQQGGQVMIISEEEIDKQLEEYEER